MRDEKKRVLWRAFQIFASSFIAVAIVGTFMFVTQGRDMPVLNPHGEIANQQYTLILITVGLGVFVVIPVFILLFGIAWKYRASNKKAKYDPELEGHKGLEILWWTIPMVIILALSIITYISTHALDPYKELQSDKTPVKVQVIALQWNWLFVYPESGMATLNYMNIPEDTPINLSITSDAPMNSFWIPALAGQVYAMSGMATKLHIMADSVGSYNGSSANISGPGYADMRFKVYSMKESDYTSWSMQAAKSQAMLTSDAYAKLVTVQEHKPETTFMLMDSTLFDTVILKYMHSESNPKTENTTESHDSTMDGMDM
ncbi:MAG: ubiquinol oxidase subunit II [Candidatus Saccharimonadaceae bacterium]